VSEEPVEIVRRMYEAFHAGDAEAALAFFHPDVLLDPSAARPDAPIGKGREHVSEVTASWMAAFDEWREEIEEIRDLDGRVLVVSVQRGRGRGSGVEVEARYALLYEVSREMITTMRMYRSVEAAMAAAVGIG
jgi:ketosteroid isomerase-like protein